jgi:hypothetical protein
VSGKGRALAKHDATAPRGLANERCGEGCQGQESVLRPPTLAPSSSEITFVSDPRGFVFHSTQDQDSLVDRVRCLRSHGNHEALRNASKGNYGIDDGAFEAGSNSSRKRS